MVSNHELDSTCAHTYGFLNMIRSFKRTDVEAVHYDLAFQLVPVLLDVVVLHHDDDHVDVFQELIEVGELVFGYLVVLQEWVVALQRACQVTLLRFKELKGWRLAEVVDVLLVGQAIEANAAVVGDVVLLHNLVDAVEHECWLTVVGLHRLVDHFCQLWVVAYQEPRVDGDAVAAYARTWLEDIDAWVHIANLDDFIHVHIVVAADA